METEAQSWETIRLLSSQAKVQRNLHSGFRWGSLGTRDPRGGAGRPEEADAEETGSLRSPSRRS